MTPGPGTSKRPGRLAWLIRVWQRRFTPAGRLFLIVLVVAGAVAGSVGIAVPLYFFALGLFSLLVVDWAVGLVFRPRVTIERDLPGRVAAGATIPVRALVTNRGRLPAFDLGVVERTARPPLGPERDPVYLDVLAPGASAELVYELAATSRGAYDLDGPLAVSAFPFGLKHGMRRVDAPARLLVTPRFTRLSHVDLPVGRKHQPGGLQLVSEVGDSGEFVGNREYRGGDRLRDIHHAAWARLGKPVVREFQQEYLCRIALVADTHVPRGTRAEKAALEAGISLGAAVADVLSRLEYVIDVFAAGPDLYHFEAGRSLAHLDDILDILACVEGTARNPFETLAPAIQEELSRISTAVVVLLDWDAPRDAFVRSIEDAGVAAKVVVVREGRPSVDPTGRLTLAGPITVLTPAQVETGVDRL